MRRMMLLGFMALTLGLGCEGGGVQATPEILGQDAVPVSCGQGASPCNDDNPCTDDHCGDDGLCVFAANAGVCDDQDPCTVGDVCREGVCVPGLPSEACQPGPVTCDDGSVCTRDEQLPDGTCKNTFLAELTDCLPRIEVDAPARGHTVAGDGAVEVRGRVYSSAVPLMSLDLKVNGNTVLVDTDGRFATAVDSVQGMNPVFVDVADRFGNEAHTVRAYYYSPMWYPTAGFENQDTLVHDAVRAFLGREFWDDNDPATLDDLASLAVHIFDGLDLNAMITNPLAAQETGCKYEVSMTNIRTGTPVVELSPNVAGIFLSLTLPNLFADVALAPATRACPTLAGTLHATLSVVSLIQISLDALGNPVVTMVGTNVYLQGLQFDIAGMDSNLLQWLLNLATTTIQGVLANVMTNLLDNEVPPRLEAALAAINLDREFTIPAIEIGDTALTDPVTIRLRTRLSRVEHENTGLDLAVSATVASTPNNTHEVLGSIGRAACLDATPTPFAYPSVDCTPGEAGVQPCGVQVGVHDDLLNRALFALWWAGMMKLDVPVAQLSDEVAAQLAGYGIQDLVVHADLLLPPILTTCNPVGSWMLQVGDARVVADMTMGGQALQVEAFATVSAEAVIGAVAGTTLSIGLGDVVLLDFEITEITESMASLQGSLENLLRDQLFPSLIEDYANTTLFSLQIPEFDLSAAEASLPPDTMVGVNLQALAPVDGYTLVSGGLR